jgi:H+/gluconate symporter-like permease
MEVQYMAVFGIFLALALLIFLAYRGFSVVVMAPVCALLAAFVGMAILPTYKEIFLPNLANYLKVYFPFFLLGAIFGKAMEESGAAKAIAKAIVNKLGKEKAIMAVVLSAAVLTYGGISLFVVAFAVYPFAASVFKEADIPKRLLPATIALGAFTFTMDALPGTPQIQNSIPMKYFNTDLYAAPVTGIIATIIILAAGLTYLEWRKRSAQAKGEGYGAGHKNEPEFDENEKLPSFIISMIPLVAVLVVTLILQKGIFPNWNIAAWATQKPYSMVETGIKGTMNNWALIIGLLVGSVLACLSNPKTMKTTVPKAINLGAVGSFLAILNTSSEVGFGNVIKSLPAFKVIANALIGINPNGSPLLSEAVAVNVLAGTTGSASGGMSIVLEMFGQRYLEWAHATGTSPELLHRVASMASGGMDTLPHNGAVITLLGITGLTHKQSYRDIFFITCLKTGTCFFMIFLQSIFHFV